MSEPRCAARVGATTSLVGRPAERCWTGGECWRVCRDEHGARAARPPVDGCCLSEVWAKGLLFGSTGVCRRQMDPPAAPAQLKPEAERHNASADVEEGAVVADVPSVLLTPAVRDFFKLLPVQQTALLFVGSVFYDAGSIACVAFRKLRLLCRRAAHQVPRGPAARRHLLYCRLRDVHLRNGAGLEGDSGDRAQGVPPRLSRRRPLSTSLAVQAKEMDSEMGTHFGARAWMRWVALIVNVAGGIITARRPFSFPPFVSRLPPRCWAA